jgi:hypothetical protein
MKYTREEVRQYEEIREDLFDGEAIDLSKERGRVIWNLENNGEIKERETWLTEFASIRLYNDYIEIDDEEGIFYIPISLIERIVDFLQGGVE